jgi:3-oxoacyl-[acyl-carrier-protein] synthase-1
LTINDALEEAGVAMEQMDFRIVDTSGEHYYFKESALALLRTLHTPVQRFDMWCPADCFGEIGAAVGPAIWALAKNACEKGYALGGNILCQFSDFGRHRGASVLQYTQGTW